MPQALFYRSLMLGLALAGAAPGCVTPVSCETDAQCMEYDPSLRCELRGPEKRCYLATSPLRQCGDMPVATLTSIKPSDDGQRFGSALAAWGGSRLLVGNPGAKTISGQVGDAVVFDLMGDWKNASSTSLNPNGSLNLVDGAAFGATVALSGSTALVTSLQPGPDNLLNIFLFTYDGMGKWQLSQKLVPTFMTNQMPQLSVGAALMGEHAFFSTYHQEGGATIGRIYDYSASTGLPSPPYSEMIPAMKSNKIFLAATGTRLFFSSPSGISSHPVGTSFGDPGSTKLEKSDIAVAALAASGSVVAFGLPNNSNKIPFYTADVAAQGWNEGIAQPAADPEASNHGKNVALDADLLAVSNIDKFDSVGEVRIFQNVKTAWQPLATIVGKNLGAVDGTNGAFGAALAVSKDYIFVGAPKSKVNVPGAPAGFTDGAVFVYSCPPK